MQISMKNCNTTGGNVNYGEVSEGVKKIVHIHYSVWSMEM